MRKLSVLALLVFVGCAGELTDNNSDQPTIEIVNTGAEASDVALSTSPDCSATMAAQRSGKSVDRARVITIAAGAVERVATGQMNYLCANENSIGYPIRPGAVYSESEGLIVEGEEGR